MKSHSIEYLKFLERKKKEIIQRKINRWGFIGWRVEIQNKEHTREREKIIFPFVVFIGIILLLQSSKSITNFNLFQHYLLQKERKKIKNEIKKKRRKRENIKENNRINKKSFKKIILRGGRARNSPFITNSIVTLRWYIFHF